MKKMNEVRQKIVEWQEMNTSYLNEIKSLLSDKKALKDFQVISYFTYSLNLLHKEGNENYCLGSFHIQNVGGRPLTNPYICIKVSSDSPFDFSGKYLYKDSKQKMRLANAWERINDPMDKQEYWLKPVEKNVLNPSETLSFSSFQMKWLPESSYAGSIMGFTYGDEAKDGINSLNQINISGTIIEEGGNE
ncbi:hypothetical protein [Oceanobacillus polygoni]|uniref:Uncharacterized protein n=1 Tax=Oceanobacillus polygoni TaxID=1235259 RepID=A0A9X0YSS7_9BACI|nr:hypothetical protein [Oceanobacillus polygoni]MBP2077989.1 hypothetical protein [Oceanobacillus polygoni]